ncbi:aspartate/glutamate racemase family protein [Pseudophaeobacter leonis]|uniref:aspartate/glutamate racemase family protein n=1 Tax=Pseudophaeobacter leonis TaxID=1144477 RepID=UPI0009F4FCC6|nr:aspartate/glutamate racemase family protein [Pseudophaeobacter leonis]
MTVLCGGQNICGLAIGVLSLESYFPKPAGHIKNPASLPFTTTYEILQGITVPELLNNPSPEMLEPIVAAAIRLEKQGVKAITGSSGFVALFQREIAQSVSVPVFLSSLLQVPLAYQMTRAPVGVLTASAPALTPKHIDGDGASGVPIIVQGLEETQEFASVILRNERNSMDLNKIEAEVQAAASRLIEAAPDIKSVVLECTDLPPYAQKLQHAIKRPVFDLTTLATMMHDVVLRQSYAGV